MIHEMINCVNEINKDSNGHVIHSCKWKRFYSKFAQIPMTSHCVINSNDVTPNPHFQNINFFTVSQIGTFI